MAKMKSYAVDVEIVIKRTIFVEARRPGGAVEKITSFDDLREAIKYHHEDDGGLWDDVLYGGAQLKPVSVREV